LEGNATKKGPSSTKKKKKNRKQTQNSRAKNREKK